MIGTREAVGIVLADELLKAAEVVDQLDDPSDCEYAIIDNFGGILCAAAEKALPAGHGRRHEEPGALQVLADLQISEAWLGALQNEELEFRPMFPGPANDH